MNRKRKTEKVLSWGLLLVGLFIFGLLIHRAGWNNLIALFQRANKGYWTIGVGIYALSMLFRALKWWMLLMTIRSVAFGRFLPIYFFNSVLGNITPFKSGEAVGPVLFKRYLDVEIGHGFSVIFIDRILELIWMLLCLGLGFTYLVTHISMTSLLSNTLILAGGLILLLIGFLIVVLFVEPLGYGILSFLPRHIKLERLRHMIMRLRDELIHFYAFRKGNRLSRKMVVLNLFTALAFLSQFVAVWIVVISLQPVHFMASLTAQAIAIPVSIISFIPAGIGIAAAGYQAIMMQFGYEYGPIVGATLLSKVLFLTLIFICGWISSFNIRRLERNFYE